MRALSALCLLVAAGCNHAGALAPGSGSDLAQPTDGATGEDLGTGPICPPPDTPSRQTVHIIIRNDATTDRYLATPLSVGASGPPWCTAFAVTDAVGVDGFVNGWATSLNFQCGCECTAPGEVYSNAYHRIAAGASYALADWDARYLVPCNTYRDCGGGRQSVVLAGNLQPLPPGTYELLVSFEPSLPQGCTQSAPDNFSCSPPPGGRMPYNTVTESTCPSSGLPGEGNFTLPSAGDVTVTISLH